MPLPPADDRSRLWRLLSRHADFPLVRRARRAAERAALLLHAENHDPRTNGELLLLRALGPTARLVVDVGANRGDWARLAVAACPNATVHCFEIAAPTREALRAACAGRPRIVVADCGLADRAGTARVGYYPDDDRLTSLAGYPHHLPREEREEQVTTGDDYLDRVGIERVDLLKVDAEGADLLVLRGFERALHGGRIDVVQFEYGYAGIYTGALLANFYALLEPAGYELGRLTRGGVEFTAYSPIDETFYGPNVVGVRRELADLRRRLARRPT